jgi:RNA polymerase sigma-70 factor (ECF subfamily)
VRGQVAGVIRVSVPFRLLGIARRVLYEAARSGLFDQTQAFPEAAPAEDIDKRIDLDLALRSLAPPDREAILLVDVLGFSPMEAASIANTSREAFRVRLHRARKRFQEVYSR